ncbi:hypothetical protein JTE90_014188 [Oedothorax gibbosus]|uniref:Uncharacterized protein n=1 Tax=Oedothorax gibbosus TaxID=931172 RepID=A0AAV6TKV9_9ARAC|nr:hypothetical protein JTE90_014188 [Oedothorax gibbosus]
MKQMMNMKGKKGIKKRLRLISISSSEDEDLMLSELVGSSKSERKPLITDLCNDDSGDDVLDESNNQILNSKRKVHLKTNDETKINIGDFVVAKFASKRSVVACIGCMEGIDEDE